MESIQKGIHSSVDEKRNAGTSPADQDESVKKSLDRIKHKFIVMSGKGGVGKTSTSVNLAMALSKKGHRVGIMDVGSGCWIGGCPAGISSAVGAAAGGCSAVCS